MPDFDLESMSTSTSVAWPKRGRVKKPLPEKLVNILHSSFTNKNTATLQMPRTQAVAFGRLLTKAGGELNYRIERYIEDVDDDLINYHFRVNGRRKNAQP